MRFELLLCVLGLVLMVVCFFADRDSNFQNILPALLLILLLVHLWVTPYRWQVLPLWFVLITTQANFLFHLSTKSPGWFALLLLCTLGVSLSVVLVVGIPLLSLPVPGGRYGIGSVTHTLVDSDRTAFETSTYNGRRILVKMWYPSDHKSSSKDHSGESMWQDLYASVDVPKSLRWFTAYLQTVQTNSLPGAAFATGVKNSQLLIYNHSMISTVSENTTLMEHLASHGYVVFSVQHLDQLTEFNALNEAVPETERERNKALLKRLTSTSSRDERAELSLEYFSASSATNRIVAARALDIDYVLNNALELFAKIPSLEKGTLSADRVGLLGFSVGGAVATEFSKNDERCVTVVNMDGGLYGTRIEEPVSVPYLMMDSEQNEGTNDQVLKNATTEVQNLMIPQTKHLDYHDVKLLFPILRWLKVLGKAPTQEFLGIKNTTIRKHFDAFLG